MGLNRFERYVKGLELSEIAELEKATHSRLSVELDQEDEAAEVASGLASIAEYLKEGQEFIDSWGQMQGISSGFKSIDALTHGFVGGELIILGGYSHRGKTQTAVNIADRVASDGTPVLFITLEMTKPQLTSRFMRLSEVDADTPIFLQRVEQLEANHIDGLITKAVASGAGLVIIDHLHYFARGSDMIGKVGSLSRDFKRLAIKHNVPIVLLSQLSRPEKSAKKVKLPIPSLSALKESGYIEQDADIVLMVHRNMAEDLPDDHDEDLSEVFIAQRKNRNRGMIGSQTAFLRHDSANGVRLFEQSSVFPVKQTSMLG